MVSSNTSWVMVTWDNPSLMIQADRRTSHDVHAPVNSQIVQLTIKLADPEEGIISFQFHAVFRKQWPKMIGWRTPPPLPL